MTFFTALKYTRLPAMVLVGSGTQPKPSVSRSQRSVPITPVTPEKLEKKTTKTSTFFPPAGASTTSFSMQISKVNNLPVSPQDSMHIQKRGTLTPLGKAVQNKNLAKVRELISSGVNVDENRIDTTPLMIASAIGCFECCVELLKAGANLQIQDSFGMSALMFAANQGNLNIVNLLIAHGADVNLKAKLGLTALTYAIKADSINLDNSAVVKRLVEYGANIEDTDTEGSTPILWAARNGTPKTVKLLVGVK